MKLVRLFLLALVSVSLTGCLSHWFLESETRLQVENATEDCTLIAIDVISEDGSSVRPWIHEKVLPGERSHVVETDWVGEFNLRFKFVDAKNAKDTIVDTQSFEIEGGSLYLMVEGDQDSLTYRFR